MARTMKTIRLVLAGCSLALFTCCGKPAAAAPTGNTPPAPISAELVAKLAKADAVDGKTDKVVHKCAGCALGMDGSPAHSLQVQDYTMHFCKEGCLAPFKADPAKELTALKIRE